MNRTTTTRLIAAAAFAALPLLAGAAPQATKIEQLPRVVITGKSTQSVAVVQQLPRVVIEGRSVGNINGALLAQIAARRG
ncbi:hypothetical protein G8A07_23525 [Roseateles sp. DAIF2]|uniref:hypothetical protein n=1 Tax=Roseateles sp. DAIF2 TaxID=2714952 RepID=UPI0018A30312|nr:hypothetical protein [Roseateles sp. DAIF2]QPF75591.1 hypothetical protein G8A07_23525 [Roseateles sp. DAIF2]